MKVRLFLGFNTQAQTQGRSWAYTRAAFERLELPELVKQRDNILSFYTITLDEDDPRLPALKAWLVDEGITWMERREHIFTDRELQAAPLLYPILRRAFRGGPQAYHGTEFDPATGCPECGTGRVQVSAHRVRPSDLPKKELYATVGLISVMAEALVDALREANVVGVEWRQLEASTTRQSLRWWQPIPESTLPPFAPETRGVELYEVCTRCQRNGRYHTNKVPIELRYRQSAIDVTVIPDIVASWEHFGNAVLRTPARESMFAWPLLIVKPKVYVVVRRLKVRGIEWHPVELVEQAAPGE